MRGQYSRQSVYIRTPGTTMTGVIIMLIYHALGSVLIILPLLWKHVNTHFIDDRAEVYRGPRHPWSGLLQGRVFSLCAQSLLCLPTAQEPQAQCYYQCHKGHNLSQALNFTFRITLNIQMEVGPHTYC